MALKTVNSWTLSGLIMAFVDLAIAYTLLCGSALAFIPSKLLRLYAIKLPCPCTGFFGYQNNDLCLHRLLIDLPRSKIIAVEELAKHRFPYDLICCDHKSCNLHVEGHGNRKISYVGIEEESCSTSLSGPTLLDSIYRDDGCDSKGKKIMNQRSTSWIRRRRRAALGNGKLSPAFSSNNKDSVDAGPVHPFYDSNGVRIATSESLNAGSRAEDSFLVNLGYKTCNVGDNANVIQVLDQALAEEKAAHAMVYQELEKERAAAASAADEAMAMILRLQEDKASIEMEARQYHRVIEEKFTYDEEEMKILKEILFRREKEIHFLEKELEAYEQINFLGNDQVEGDSSYKINNQESIISHSIDLDENPLALPILESSKSIGEKEVAIGAKWPSDYEHIHSLPFGKDMSSGSCTDTMLDTELIVYDVHVIDDKTVLSKEDHEKENGPLSEVQNTEFSSDMHSQLVVSNNSLRKTYSVDSLRHSPILIDDERLKIDNEVEQLRERLRIVQEEKEKLTFSAEHMEIVNAKLKLVEDIMSQLQEIQQLRKPVRPASLPSPSSKVSLKKRHVRSASNEDFVTD